jgi:hypothetical protein
MTDLPSATGPFEADVTVRDVRRSPATAEASVIGWMPAAAVYFRHPDGHLIGYVAMLDEAPPRTALSRGRGG